MFTIDEVFGGWDEALLGIELGELKELGFDLDLIGFSETELTALTAQGTAGLTDPDEVPDLPEEPVSRAGDLWQLGRHRLLCGDSTHALSAEASEEIDLLRALAERLSAQNGIVLANDEAA